VINTPRHLSGQLSVRDTTAAAVSCYCTTSLCVPARACICRIPDSLLNVEYDWTGQCCVRVVRVCEGMCTLLMADIPSTCLLFTLLPQLHPTCDGSFTPIFFSWHRASRAHSSPRPTPAGGDGFSQSIACRYTRVQLHCSHSDSHDHVRSSFLRCRRWKTKTMAQGHTPARPPIAHAPYRISLCASLPTQQQQQQLARCIQVMCSASAACRRRRWNAQEAHTLVCFGPLSNTMIACTDCVDGVDARGTGCRDGCRVSYLPWPCPKMVSFAQHHPPAPKL
jgi:hypothetical protein